MVADPTDIFTPDFIIPQQLEHRSNLSRSGECRLLFAILCDAIQVILNWTTASKNDKDEAEQWLNDEEQAQTYFSIVSFKGICEALGLDPDYLRRGIEHYRRVSAKQKIAASRLKLEFEDEIKSVFTKSIHETYRRGKVRLKGYELVSKHEFRAAATISCKPTPRKRKRRVTPKMFKQICHDEDA